MWRLINYRLIDYAYLKGSCWELFYRWFNVVEAAVWLAIAIYVFSRYLRNKKTPYEIVYSTLFVLFGLSDLREILNLPVWLLAVKAIILTSILYTRSFLKKRFYNTMKI